jgi:hypothetical protein
MITRNRSHVTFHVCHLRYRYQIFLFEVGTGKPSGTDSIPESGLGPEKNYLNPDANPDLTHKKI